AFVRRINALPDDSRNLLLVVAAEETGSIRTVLGAAARLGWSGEGLAPAEREGLVWTSGTRIRFHHPILRSATYRSAPFERRHTVHQAIAVELTAGAEPDRAVWHRAAAATAPDENLARALEDSADAARRRGGEAAAASVLQRAAQLSETPEARRERTVTAAVVALDSGQPDLARTLTEGALAESVPEATLTHLLGHIEFYSGDPAVAHAHLMRCGELLSATDPEEAAWLFAGASSAAFHAGDLDATANAARRITALDCSAATRTAGRSMAEGGSLTGSRLWELVGDLTRSQPMAGGRPWMWATAVAWLGPDQLRRAGSRISVHACRFRGRVAGPARVRGFVRQRDQPDERGDGDQPCGGQHREAVARGDSGCRGGRSGCGVRDGAERGQSQGGAELPGAAEQARCRTGFVWCDPDRADRDDRAEADAESDTRDDRRPQNVGEEAAVRGDEAEPGEPDRGQRAAADDQGASGEPRAESDRKERPDDDPEGEWQEHQPGHCRVLPQDVL